MGIGFTLHWCWRHARGEHAPACELQGLTTGSSSSVTRRIRPTPARTTHPCPSRILHQRDHKPGDRRTVSTLYFVLQEGQVCALRNSVNVSEDPSPHSDMLLQAFRAVAHWTDFPGTRLGTGSGLGPRRRTTGLAGHCSAPSAHQHLSRGLAASC